MDASADPANFEVRATTSEDAAALNDLYLRVSGRRRTLEQWRAEWLEVPGGPAPSWVLVERATGRLVGHHGLIPLPLRAGAERLRGARTENTMVDPDYRTTLYYPAYEAQLLKTYRGRFDVLLTTTGKAVQGTMRRRFGYRTVDRWTTLTVTETLAYRAARELGALGAIAASALGRWSLSAPGGGGELEPTRDFERVERLWSQSISSASVSLHRSAEYLHWRFVRHAWRPTSTAVLTRRGHDVGFLAWHEEEARGKARRVMVDDAFAREDDEPTYRELFERLAWSFRREPVRLQLRTVVRDRPLFRAARSIAPRWMRREPREDDAELLVLAPGLPREATFEATRALDEAT
jgi:hypothetical protein